VLGLYYHPIAYIRPIRKPPTQLEIRNYKLTASNCSSANTASYQPLSQVCVIGWQCRHHDVMKVLMPLSVFLC
jgi:hypothetical protein